MKIAHISGMALYPSINTVHSLSSDHQRIDHISGMKGLHGAGYGAVYRAGSGIPKNFGSSGINGAGLQCILH